MRRRFRGASTYRRRHPTREPYDVVLIVCEGAKTEPNYFEALRIKFKLSSANVRVSPPEYGNDPLSVVRFAEDELGRESTGYNRAYCVFDRNGHANYVDARTYIEHCEYGMVGRLFPITSIPCFEVWLLLHYRYSTAPYQSCDKVIRELRTHLENYQKGSGNVFQRTCDLIDVATANAERLARDNDASQSDNPATEVHKLVKYLRELRKTPNGTD